MGSSLRFNYFRWRYFRRFKLILFLASSLILIRFTKTSIFIDIYALLTKPLLPGSAQKEWISNGVRIEQQAKLILLEEDNKRLRELLSLQKSSNKKKITAAVISRTPSGWWQQIIINKGSIHGIKIGNSVVGPGGLLGRVQKVTPTTAIIQLLTSPNSRIGVWAPRTKRHGLLIGLGTNRPRLIFFEREPKEKPGDLISTSPASTLIAPNLPVGIIQLVNKQAMPSPYASVQLIAAPHAIDWVQIKLK